MVHKWLDEFEMDGWIDEGCGLTDYVNNIDR